MKGKVKCTCGWSWNKSDSSVKDMYICYQCGRDNSNNMKNGGWLDNIPQAQEGEALYTPPKSHYKRLYGHAKDYSQGENEKMRIDPNTGYGYFPPELSTVQQKEVPDSPWNVSRFLFDPFILNASQGVHNSKYDKEGKLINLPGDGMEEGRLANNLSRRERYNAAKEDITNYYKEDLKQNDADVEKKVDDTMDLIRKMRRTEEMMQRHNASYTDFKNSDPQEVFKSAVGFDELFPIESVRGDIELSPAQAKRAYKMYLKTWKGVSGKEARQSAREELKKAEDAFKLAKEQKKQGLNKSNSSYKSNSDYDPEAQFYFDNYGTTLASSKLYDSEKSSTSTSDEETLGKPTQYYNTDPKRGKVETPGNEKGVRYIPISNSIQLEKWKEQQDKLKNGGWLDAYNDDVPQAQNGIEGTMAGLTDKGFNYNGAWGGQFQNGGKKKKGVQDQLRDAEHSVDKWLGHPMQKAFAAGEQVAEKWFNPKTKKWERDDARDNFRHPMAGRYTSEAIQNKFPSWMQYTPIPKMAGLIGANALGVGHEASTFFHKKDKRGVYDKLREAGEDIFNNAVGSAVGSLPISEEEKTQMLLDLSNQNRLPDGVSSPRGGMYLKKQTGGSIPGAVGFTYARTQGIPSEGPYAKKTLPSAQNGQEMKYYQEGLDWKPRTISRNGDRFKLKDERGQAMKSSESTGVKKRDFNVEQSKFNRAYMAEMSRRAKLTKEQREREDYNAYNEQHGSIKKYVPESKWERTKAIVSNPMTAAGYVARGENLPGRFQYGPRNEYDYAVDWINPLQGAVSLSNIPGQLYRGEFLDAGLSGLDALDLGAYAKGARAAAKPLAMPIKKTLAKGALKTLEGAKAIETLGREAVQGINDVVIYPLKYRNQIKEIENLHKNLSTDLGSDEARKRMSQVLGIDVGNLDLPSLTTRPRMGSHYNPLINNINIDLRQANELAKGKLLLSPASIHQHEVGHWMQREAYKNSPEYKEAVENYEKNIKNYKPVSLPENPTMDDMRNWASNSLLKPYKPFVTSHPTVIDRFSQQLYDYNPNIDLINIGDVDHVKKGIGIDNLIQNAQYFTNRGVEPLAHLREMRQNMLDKGYIKNIYDRISEETINKFISENPTDRISSFTNPNSKQTKGLESIFRNLPSVIGAGAVGTGAAYQMQNQESNSGMREGGIIKDDRGQWDHPGEITEIGSNNITMQGVPYPVLGISDEGDTKLMQPGKNYKFKGKKVTEFPIAKNGLRQEQKGLVNLDNLTNFTNYNKSQPSGWLSKYE